MGIWIRNQNKDGLYNVDILEIHETSTNGNKHDFRIRTNIALFDLGVYSTQEKALKVLDMIEEHIEKVDTFSMEQDGYYHNSGVARVFEMPQDSEVK